MREHWLENAHGRIVAGDDELDVLADYGWVQITDEERAAIERAAQWMVQLAKDRGEIHSAGYFVDDAATLRGLLERTK